jgi:O-antigen/teichoic acid export membrane protein
MKISPLTIVKGVGWTIGAYGVGQFLRLVTNIALARLLAPELFGIMVIVNSLRTGIDLFSDVGIGQNIVQNKNADDPRFYNTAWTLQQIRGVLLWLVCLAAAAPLAHLYEAPILVLVLPVAALYFVFIGLTSVSVFLLQRRLQFAKLNVFDVILEFISAVAHVTLAFLNPTVWSLVFGGLIAAAARMIASYFLLPNLRQKLYISKQYAWQIFTFGKWIFISTIVYFLSTNFDRLYLGKVAPLAILGVYGIARTLSELLGTSILRLGSYVIFPLVASSSNVPRHYLRAQLASIRFIFLTIAALGVSLLVATADWLIEILYDERYQSAAWMLPLLIIGGWFSIICNINDATLLGLGKPIYGAVANIVKLTFLLIGLPLGFATHGILGAVMVVAAGDVCRYVPILAGQFRERLSFGVQDLVLTLIMFGLVGLWEWLRWTSGLSTSFHGLLILDLSNGRSGMTP